MYKRQVIHRECVRATPVDVGDHSEFELLAVKLVRRRSASVVAVCVYRPPGAVTATFINQLSDLLDQLVLLDLPFVIAGDFNVPGDVEGLDSRTADVFTQYGLRQHVNCATHYDGNVLDLVITQDSGTRRGQLVSEVAVPSVCFSYHCLLYTSPSPRD